MMYQITFRMRSAIAYTDLPQFDALLAYCYVQKEFGDQPQRLSIPENEIIDFEKVLPITYENGYALASQMFFDRQANFEWVQNFRTRWEDAHDKLADFGKKKREVEKSKGFFKSFDVPIQNHTIEKVWFYFETEDLPAVEELLQHLIGIGKKTTTGSGHFHDYVIEPTQEVSFNTHLLRPTPASYVSETQKETMLLAGYKVYQQFRAYKPPYWQGADNLLCLVAI